MSGGHYQLLRTNIDDEEEEGPLPKYSIGHSSSLLDRLRAAIASKHPKVPLLPSLHVSRKSESSHAGSTLGIGGKRRRGLYLGVLLVGLLSLLALLTAQRGTIRLYFMDFAPPSAACLQNRADPTSYVKYSPLIGDEGAVYHCITQRNPVNPSPLNALASDPIPFPWINSPLPPPTSATPQTLTVPHPPPIHPYRPLPDWCLDDYYTNGTTCHDAQRTMFDVIWTWVNGSDPLIMRSRAKAIAQLQGIEWDEESWLDEEEDSKSAHLYRDHDELRHSLRSVLQYFRESAERFIILTSDFEFPLGYDPVGYLLGLSDRSATKRSIDRPGSQKAKLTREIEQRKRSLMEEDVPEEGPGDTELKYARLGLLPQWLQWGITGPEKIGRWKDGDIPLEVVHHAEVYEKYDGTVFNSNSIESQLGNLAGNKAFIYFNDDCFFTSRLTSSDFHTSNYGIVFRLIAYPWMLVKPHHYPTEGRIGEWGPMEYTNYLISLRFGKRRRPYPMHQVKILQGGLMREMWAIWRDQEGLNRGHKFRGLGGLEPVYGNHTWADGVDPLKGAPRPPEEEEEDWKRSLSKRALEYVDVGELQKRQEEEQETPVVEEEETESEAQATTTGTEDQPEIPSDEDQDSEPPMEQIRDDGDAHVLFLFTHFIVERSREAMLWSFLIGRISGPNDEFGIDQRNEVWRILVEDAEAEQRGRGDLEVLVGMRKTMEPWRVQWALDQIGDRLEKSEYRFSSQDGYAYSYYGEHGLEWWHDESTYWPLLWNGDFFPEDVSSRPAWSRCTIQWNECFVPEMTSANEVFKHVAFRKMECGDCLLKALVRASGDLGLSALLPPPGRRYNPLGQDTDPDPIPVDDEDVAPHLPLTTRWQDADFSFHGVFGSGLWGDNVNLREWVMRMLERYRYVLADTGNYFNVIHNPVDAEKLFAYVDDHPKVSLLTVNDDVNAYPEKTDQRMREWFDRKFPHLAEWETPDSTTRRGTFDWIWKR